MAIKKSDKTKKKRDIRGIIHRICKIIIFRTLEFLLDFLVASTVVLLTGGYVIPILSLNVANGIGITQSTDFYTAMANWMLPMFFYVILLILAVFTLGKKFACFVHGKFTAIINKKTEKEDINL